MTGGGTATVGWLHEPTGSYLGSPSDTDYKIPGKNVTVDDMSIDNALLDMRVPDDPEIVDTVAGNFEGAFSASWVGTNPWWLNHIFGSPPSQSGTGPYTYDWAFSAGRAQSSRWYMGLDYLDGVAERVLEGVVFGSASISCNQGEAVEVSATGFYGNESKNTTVTPGSFATEPDPLIFHSGDLTISGVSQKKMQSGTLEINSGARLQRGWDRHAVDAVIGGVETTLEVNKIVDGTSNLELAYGGTSAPQTQVSGAASAALNFTTPGTSSLTFDLSGVTPGEYNWSDLVDPESDVTEDWTATVDTVTATADSSETSAL